MAKAKADRYEAEMIDAIKKHKWMRWSHIDWEVLPFGRSTAYSHGLDKLDTIKDAFAQNRHKATNYLLQKWIQSDNATLQIAAMRIVADEDDRQRLNQQYVDHTTKGKEVPTLTFVPVEPKD